MEPGEIPSTYSQEPRIRSIPLLLPVLIALQFPAIANAQSLESGLRSSCFIGTYGYFSRSASRLSTPFPGDGRPTGKSIGFGLSYIRFEAKQPIKDGIGAEFEWELSRGFNLLRAEVLWEPVEYLRMEFGQVFKPFSHDWLLHPADRLGVDYMAISNISNELLYAGSDKGVTITLQVAEGADLSIGGYNGQPASAVLQNSGGLNYVGAFRIREPSFTWGVAASFLSPEVVSVPQSQRMALSIDAEVYLHRWDIWLEYANVGLYEQPIDPSRKNNRDSGGALSLLFHSPNENGRKTSGLLLRAEWLSSRWNEPPGRHISVTTGALLRIPNQTSVRALALLEAPSPATEGWNVILLGSVSVLLSDRRE